MGTGIDTGVQELILPKQETSTPKLIPFDVYKEKGGIFSKEDYLQIANGLTEHTKLDPNHINQAKTLLADSSNLLQEDDPGVQAEAQNILKVYAFLRDKGSIVHGIDQAKQLAEERKVPYQENEPVLSTEEASIGEWSLANTDQVVFAESLRLTLGQEVFFHYIKKYPHIFAKLYPDLF